jgi:hypothetical protein
MMNPRSLRTGVPAVLGLFLLATLASAATPSIPAGTRITIRLNQAISSESAKAGDMFDATLANDVVVGGQTVAKAGDPVRGRVTYAKSSGRLSTPGQVTIRLTSVNGIAVSTTAVSRKGESHTKSNATKIGGGAAVGAVIGAIAGGGKGAAIGAGAGAAAGTGVAAATGKKDVTLSAETTYSFTVTSPASAK